MKLITPEQFKDVDDGAVIKFIQMKDGTWRFMEMDIETLPKTSAMLKEGETAEDVKCAGSFAKMGESELRLMSCCSFGLNVGFCKFDLFALRERLGFDYSVDVGLYKHLEGGSGEDKVK